MSSYFRIRHSVDGLQVTVDEFKSAVDKHQAFKGKLQTFVYEHPAIVDMLGATVDGQSVRLHQYQSFVDRLVTFVDTLQSGRRRLKSLVT